MLSADMKSAGTVPFEQDTADSLQIPFPYEVHNT